LTFIYSQLDLSLISPSTKPKNYDSTSALYTLAEVKSALFAYVAKHELVNRVEQQYLNVSSDAVFSAALYGSPNAKERAGRAVPEFVKREDALSALCGRMQPWYRIAVGSDEPFTKKGTLRPITVAAKTRQGRKVCTFITGFEQYHLSGDALAEALRVRCASSTSGTCCLFGFKLEFPF
jgi:translation initiation factor 2D